MNKITVAEKYNEFSGVMHNSHSTICIFFNVTQGSSKELCTGDNYLMKKEELLKAKNAYYLLKANS